MIHITLNLPQYRLRLQLVKRRIDPREALFPSLESLRNIHAGSKVSRFARHVLERINLKSLLGRNLTFAILATSLLSPLGSSLPAVESEKTILPALQGPLTTEVKIQYPLKEVKVNQGFSYFHPGIDLHGTLGTPIYPIAKGIVETREFGRFGYGNTIVIDHGNNLKSRYAHLSRIDVHENDLVDPSTPIGLVGSTGHSTGPHLHLEIYQDGKPTNPMVLLGIPSR